MKIVNKKYIIIAIFLTLLLFLTSCGGVGNAVVYKPIKGIEGVLDVIVLPMAGLMWALGKSVAFEYYGVVIIITTIIVRTLAWPIYAKTNDMSLKMQLMGPDQAKIEEKYSGKSDPESNQKKQMEMMQLYKKYGVGFGGCLLPLVQFPIFIAFYQTLQRVPMTLGKEYKLDFSFLNRSFLGLDLFSGRINPITGLEVGTYQTWGIIVLAGLVGITQIVSQILVTRRQKKAKLETQSTVPAYRKPNQTDTQKQTEKTMKIMMYGMTVMMVVFVYNSAAALGLYWLVGNLFTTFQGYVSHSKSKDRIETLRKKF